MEYQNFYSYTKGLLLTPEGEAIVRHASSVIEREHTIQENSKRWKALSAEHYELLVQV